MSIARDRANRSGSDPLIIGSSKISANDSDNLVVQDTSNVSKRLIMSEMHIGDNDSDKIVIKRDSGTGRIRLQTVTSGGSAEDQQSGAATVYANPNLLPVSGVSAGAHALTTSNNFLYVHNGSGWYKVAAITNEAPTISSAGNASNNFAIDGTAINIEITASDPEGVTLQYKYAVSSGSIGSTATVTSSATSGGTYSAIAANTLTTNKYFKITPSTNMAHAGSFSLTFSASDGVNVANSSASAFTLEFATYGGMFINYNSEGLTLAADNDFDILDGACTIECWVWSDPAGNPGVVLQQGSSAAKHGLYFFHQNQYMNIRIYNNNSNLKSGGWEIFDRVWTHLAFVREANGDCAAYGNGTAIWSGFNIDALTSTATQPFYLGWNGSGNTDFRGAISNFRIVKGTALYTSSFIPSFNLYAVSNTTMMTLNDTTLADKSSENNTSLLSFRGSTAIAPSYSYPWGGGSIFSNSTPAFTYTAEDMGTDSWTWECWVSCENLYYDRALYQHGQDTGSWGIYITGDTNAASTSKGKIRVYESASSGSPAETVLATSTNRIWHKDDSTTLIKNPSPATSYYQYWNHVAVTFDDSTNTGQIWIDGVPDATFTKSSAWTFTNTTASIGKDPVVKSGWYNSGRSFWGSLQDMRLVKGTVVYATPASHNTGNSTYFDGNGDYARVPNDARFAMGTGDFTIEGWIYPYDSATNQGYFAIGGTNADGFNSGNYATSLTLLRGYNVGGNLTFYGNGAETAFNDQVNPAPNTWFHFAFSRSGSTLKVFIDGVQKYTGTDGTNYSGQGCILGGGYSTGYLSYFDMSNFRIVKGTALYTSNFTVPTAPLTDISGTSLLTCQSSSGTTIDNSSHSQTITHYGNTATNSRGPFGYSFDTPTDKLTAISGTSILTLRENAAAKPGQQINPLDESGNNRTISGTAWNQVYHVMTRPWA